MRRFAVFVSAVLPLLVQAAVAAPAVSDPRALDDRLARLEAHLQNQGLLNLLRQQEELRAEIARLRGAVEEYAHAITLIEQRQKALYQDTDARLKTVEGGLKEGLAALDAKWNKRIEEMETRFVPKASVQLRTTAALGGGTPAAPAGDPALEEKAYASAHALIAKGEHAAAAKAFEAFVQSYPEGRWTGNALYWMGFAYFALGTHDKAVTVFERLLAEQGNHPKAPDAMLTLARSKAQLKDNAAARKQLDALLERYPQSKAASQARKFRATLD
jgi:tol-pal system protein YbgF